MSVTLAIQPVAYEAGFRGGNLIAAKKFRRGNVRGGKVDRPSDAVLSTEP
jgi:hypothetical protein